MQTFLPGQSVNDIRWINGDGTKLITFGPATAVAGLTPTPSAVVWTPPV